MPANNLESARASRRKWYYNNKERAKEAIYKRKEELREWFKTYKETLQCSKCDENHWSCLEFHHPDASKKEFVAAQMVSNGFSIKRMLKELEELEVLCANCHRKLHHP